MNFWFAFARGFGIEKMAGIFGDFFCGLGFPDQKAGNAKLSTTTAREQNRALGRQVYGRYPNLGKHRKIISTMAFAGLAKIWVPRWW